MDVLQQQTAALLALMSRANRPDPLGSVLGGTGGDDDEHDDFKLPGAKGPAAMEYLRREFEEKPSKFTEAVASRLRQMASIVPGAAASPVASARAFVQHEVPFGSFKTLGYMAWGIACAWDAFNQGLSERAMGVLSLLLVGCEQTALDEGRWPVGWLMTLLPEPPWGSMGKRPMEGSLRPFSKIADPRWVAAAVSYVRDVDRLQAAKRSFATPARGSEDGWHGPSQSSPAAASAPQWQQQQGAGAPKAKSKTKGAGKGGGAGGGGAGGEA